MFGFDPITLGVGALLVYAFKKQSGTAFGQVTPEREELFRNAMAHCIDPQKLQKLAEIFRQEGLKVEAAVLRKRAEWRGRSEAKRKEHQEIFDRAMKSESVQSILAVAAAFEDMTATFKANKLRERVQKINEEALRKQGEEEAAHEKVPVESAPSEAAAE